MKLANRLTVMSANRLRQAHGTLANSQGILCDYKYRHALRRDHLQYLREKIMKGSNGTPSLRNQKCKEEWDQVAKDLLISRRHEKDALTLSMILTEFIGPKDRQRFNKHIKNLAYDGAAHFTDKDIEVYMKQAIKGEDPKGKHSSGLKVNLNRWDFNEESKLLCSEYSEYLTFQSRNTVFDQ